MVSRDNWPIVPRRVGRCIYCGKVGSALQTEHIIPAGLNGTWVLIEASCATCSAVTSDFERKTLRGALLPLRAKAGLRSRKNKLPDVLPLEVEREGAFRWESVATKNHPALAVVPIYPPPAHLTGAAIDPGKMVVNARCIGLGDPGEISKALGSSRFRQHAAVDPYAFARMLAKIAYGVSIARWGYDVFAERWVLPTIMGAGEDAVRWVGCNAGARVNKREGLHLVTSRVVNNEAHVYILLFAPGAREEYLVVVGSIVPERAAA